MNIEAMKAKLRALNKATKAPHYEDYDVSQVRQLLDGWMQRNGLTGAWNAKRGGYIAQCPGSGEHSHPPRRDDCWIETHTKSNGFIYLYYNCRHNSCSATRRDESTALNREWEQYLYENYKE